MKKFLYFTVLLMLTAGIFSSCHKAVLKQTLYIPKDASFILSTNIKNIQDKIAGSGIAIDSLFKTFLDSTNSGASSAGIKSWKDLTNSGIDFDNSFFIFMNSTGSIMSGTTTVTGIVGAMKDPAAFETFLKKEIPTKTLQKGSNYTFEDLPDGSAVGWNSDVVVFSSVKNINLSGAGNVQSNPADASEKELAILFSQKAEESIASTPEFKTLIADKSDMILWTNSSSILSSIPFLGMTKFSDLLKDSYTASTLNFEDGEVVVNSKSYSGKDLQNILSKYTGPEVDMGLVNKYPFPVNGYAVFSFNPQLIGAILKYGGVDGTANQYFQQMNFTTDDILKAFKGDFAVIFSNFGIITKPNEFSPGDTLKKPTAKLLVEATIGDKASFNKIMSSLVSKGEVREENGQYVIPNMFGLSINLDQDNLIVATDSTLLQTYKAGKSGNASIPSDVFNKSQGNSLAFYLDIGSMLNALTPDNSPGESGTAGNDVLNTARATFKDVIADTKNFDGKSVNTTIELRTRNSKENSLVSMLKFFSAVSKMNNIQIKNSAVVKLDSVPATVIPDPAASAH